MNFEYLETIRKDSSIDIETPGKTCLRAFTDDGLTFYLSLNTELGFTRVKQFGPFDYIGNQDTSFSYTTYEFEYNDKRVHKIIDDFLNGRIPKAQVFEIDFDTLNIELNKVKL